MKTLIQVNIEPRVGMVVEALKGRYKHHIIGFGVKFNGYDCYHKPKIEENEFNTWQPVARDIEFEKQIAKLKAMQKFNKGR